MTDFMNSFDKLNIDELPTEDEAELDKMAGKQREETVSTPAVPRMASKSKSKRMRRKASAEPLERYKITSEAEFYFAVCFFVRDLLYLRRYTFNLWKQAGLGKVHRAVASAVSNLVVKVVETAQYELAMDYPDFLHYRGVINHLVRNVDVDIIGSATEGRRAAMRDAEAGLLLNTHNDLVQFMIEVRKQRNGRPGPSLKSVNWNPNFVSAESERSLITSEIMC
ncbi:hypothetical protein B0J14DRAFT_9457 [Halenospora varia]|nr:hypothetical protein B0J14DRAFT_9457 [Halenospora varia]